MGGRFDALRDTILARASSQWDLGVKGVRPMASRRNPHVLFAPLRRAASSRRRRVIVEAGLVVAQRRGAGAAIPQSSASPFSCSHGNFASGDGVINACGPAPCWFEHALQREPSPPGERPPRVHLHRALAVAMVGPQTYFLFPFLQRCASDGVFCQRVRPSNRHTSARRAEQGQKPLAGHPRAISVLQQPHRCKRSGATRCPFALPR